MAQAHDGALTFDPAPALLLLPPHLPVSLVLAYGSRRWERLWLPPLRWLIPCRNSQADTFSSCAPPNSPLSTSYHSLPARCTSFRSFRPLLTMSMMFRRGLTTAKTMSVRRPSPFPLPRCSANNTWSLTSLGSQYSPAAGSTSSLLGSPPPPTSSSADLPLPSRRTCELALLGRGSAGKERKTDARSLVQLLRYRPRRTGPRPR